MSVDLPHEILCRIFRNAAASSTPSCRTLCEVSTWVRHLALPLLYRTVAISNAACLDAFFDRLIISATLVCPPSPTFRPSNVVRHLWVPFASETLMSVVRHCDDVTHLVIHHHDLFRLPDVTAPSPPEHRGCPSIGAHAGIGDLHIFVLNNQELQHRRSPSYDAISAHAPFSRITHLRLGDPLGAFTQVPIKYMPRLAHVAVPYFDDEEEDFDDIISDIFKNRSVKVLVVTLEHENLCKMERRMVEGWVCEYRKEDARVCAVTQLYSKHEMEWDAEARGGATIWERAVDYTRLLMDRWGVVSESAPMHDMARPDICTDSYVEYNNTIDI